MFIILALQAAGAAAARFEALIAAERAAVKELEALLEDGGRKLVMARERLEALQLARFEMLQPPPPPPGKPVSSNSNSNN